MGDTQPLKKSGVSNKFTPRLVVLTDAVQKLTWERDNFLFQSQISICGTENMETTSSGLPNAKPRIKPPLAWWQIWISLTKQTNKQKTEEGSKNKLRNSTHLSILQHKMFYYHNSVYIKLLAYSLLVVLFFQFPWLKLSVASHCPSSRNCNLSCYPNSLQPTHTWLHLFFSLSPEHWTLHMLLLSLVALVPYHATYHPWIVTSACNSLF